MENVTNIIPSVGSGKDGLTPHIGENGNWLIGEVDTGVKAQGQDGTSGVSPHIDEATGNWFIGEVDTGVKAKGTDGKDGTDGDDGTTPHIGANGNWFLGETDTGVAAQGKSDTRIETIMLPVADWDSDTLSQAITCTGVLEDETKQIITTVALPGNEEVCETCHIICSAFAEDTLTFTAAELPSVDVYIYVILESVSGGDNVSNNVYSTEETVVGTWIDGKPLYRQVIIGTAPIVATNGTFVWSMFPLGCSVDFAMPVTGHLLNTQSDQYLSIPYTTNDSAGQLKSTVERAKNRVMVGSNVAGWSGMPIVLFVEYTKTTDTATIAIPSTTALMDAYEEGVNEA